MNKVLNTYEQQGQFKNKVINGDFDFWQRGTSQTTSGYGSTDRWVWGNTGTTFVVTKETFTLGQSDVPDYPGFYARTDVTSSAGASNHCVKSQRIEGVSSLSGEQVALSFWAKADASKNIATEFQQNFGSGGSPSSPVLGTGVTTHTLTTSWQKFTSTITIPSVAGKTLGTNNDFLQLNFWFDAGSDFNARTNSLGQQSGIFDIAHVQLEKGNVATEFETRHVGQELSLCQRYFNKSYPVDTAVGTNTGTNALKYFIDDYVNNVSPQATFVVNYPVEMRATPSITGYNPVTGATDSVRDDTGADVAMQNTGISSRYAQLFCQGATGANHYLHYTADAEL
jgi:hypothetical protein